MLRSWVNSTPPTVEYEHLDFKSASVSGNAISDSDVKKTWSEALAGFATTSGGVLVWGIDGRKPKGATVDQACDLHPVIDPDGFKSRLQQLLHQATDPPVPGVLIEAVHDTPGQGFVVCYVPESDYKPHRAESGGKRWVMRIGDSFVDVPPPVLRSLFFPHRRSYIFMRAATQMHWGTTRETAGTVRVGFQLRLYNEGPATATDLVILAKNVENLKYDVSNGWRQTPGPVGMQFTFGRPVHPGTMLEIAEAIISFRHVGLGGKLVEATDVDLEYQLFASDQVPQLIRFHCSAEEINQQNVWTAFPEPMEMQRFR